jgi:hypothetical protein
MQRPAGRTILTLWHECGTSLPWRPLRPELTALLGVWLSSQLAGCTYPAAGRHGALAPAVPVPGRAHQSLHCGKDEDQRSKKDNDGLGRAAEQGDADDGEHQASNQEPRPPASPQGACDCGTLRWLRARDGAPARY